jgi:phage repressor protein C with HTH and peptisase S24 domain
LNPPKNAANQNLIRVLQLDADGALGDGAQNEDFPEIVRAMDFDAPYIRTLIGFVPAPGRLCLITGRGPSMIPIINPGDIVIVDRGIDHFDGDGIYLINTGSGQQIKSLNQRNGTIYVVSANSLVAPEYELKPEALIGGKVYLRNRIDRLS